MICLSCGHFKRDHDGQGGKCCRVYGGEFSMSHCACPQFKRQESAKRPIAKEPKKS